MIKTNCEDCIHNNVCINKSKIKLAETELSKYDWTEQSIDIIITCQDFNTYKDLDDDIFDNIPIPKTFDNLDTGIE